MPSFFSRVPWSREPSLKEKAEEVGVNFEKLINEFASDKTDMEIASDFGTDEKIIAHLRDHFLRIGVHSIMGQD